MRISRNRLFVFSPQLERGNAEMQSGHTSSGAARPFRCPENQLILSLNTTENSKSQKLKEKKLLNIKRKFHF